MMSNFIVIEKDSLNKVSVNAERIVLRAFPRVSRAIAAVGRFVDEDVFARL